jgi:nucleotide-binding universal stress UspA family protein
VADAEQTMESIRAETASEGWVEIRLVEGSSADCLIEIAESERAEWIVVGSRSRSASSGAVGNVLLQLARRAPCPVVVVPLAVGNGVSSLHTGPASIVCGLDGSEHALAAARLAGEVGSCFGLRVLLVHALPTVADAAAPEAEQIMARATEAVTNPGTEVIVERGRQDHVLAAIAERENAQLIAIAAHGTSRHKAAHIGSVASSVTASSPVPLILVSQRAERRIVDRPTAPSAR